MSSGLLVLKHRRSWQRARWWATRRSPAVVTFAAAGCAMLGTFLAASSPQGGPAAPARKVALATRDLAPGTVLTERDFAVRSGPETVIAAAAADGTDLTGRIVALPISNGEPIVSQRLGPGASGVAARVPPGWRAVAIASDERLPPLVVGQNVDLYGPSRNQPETMAFIPSSNAAAAEALVLTTGGLVIDAGEHSVTVAVKPDDAPAVASALADDLIVVVLHGSQ